MLNEIVLFLLVLLNLNVTFYNPGFNRIEFFKMLYFDNL